MRIFYTGLLFFSWCLAYTAQDMEIYCLTIIDQRLPEYLHGKCFFGEENKDSIEMVYSLGHLRFIDTDKRLFDYLKSDTSQMQMNWSQTHKVRLCFVVDRLIGRKKVEKRMYSISEPVFLLKDYFKHPDELLVYNIITLNKKKDKYLFYMRWGSLQSAITDKIGRKNYWKTFVYSGQYF